MDKSGLHYHDLHGMRPLFVQRICFLPDEGSRDGGKYNSGALVSLQTCGCDCPPHAPQFAVGPCELRLPVSPGRARKRLALGAAVAEGYRGAKFASPIYHRSTNDSPFS